MKHCCENKADELAQLRLRQSGVLKIVLAINLLMFFVEMTSGILSQSTSLKADSLDMLGDASVYGFSLFVLSKDLRWKAGAAFLKGSIMVAFGIGVLIDVVMKILADVYPVGEMISLVGCLALLANGICLYLLLRHKNDDVNMKSTWLCSRNDVIANVGVIAAGILVVVMNSKWPDITIGFVIAGLFLQTSVSVLREAAAQLS